MSVSKIVRDFWEQPNSSKADKIRPVESAEKPHKKKRIKVLKPSEIINKQRSIYEFTGAFLESFGKPERHARWFITGPSFSGKSSFVVTLCDYLTLHGIVDYNNHEEAGGDAQTVADKIKKHIAADNRHRIRFYKAPIESETHETFLERLMKKGSADFAVLDSVQHAGMNKNQYLELTNKLSNPRKGKSIIFINHWVKNDYTKFLKHDADIKLEIIGFVVRVESRYGGGKPYVIWEEGAKRYWKKQYNKVIKGQYWPGMKK